MRRLLVILAGLLALVPVGCGGGGGPSAGNTRAEALSFMPRDALQTVLVQTDEDSGQVKGALDLVRGFPGGAIALGQLEDRIDRTGVKYRDDVKPLLGHPLALALTADRGVVAAIVASDGDAVDRLLDDLHASKRGERAGFTTYAVPNGSALARDGDTLVAAGDMAELDGALDRHHGKAGQTEAAFDRARGNLPDDALLTGTGDPAALFRGSDVSDTGLPWLDALTGFAFTVTTSTSGVTLDARLDTSGGELTEGDLPLDTGDEPPKVSASPGRITIGIHDLARLETFLESAARATDRSAYRRFRSGEDGVRSATGVDFSGDVAGELSGDTTVAVDPRTGSVALRSGVHDPAAMGDALERVQGLLPTFLGSVGVSGATLTSAGTDLWAVQRGGRTAGGLGVVGDQFVAGGVPPDVLAAFANRPTKADPGAKGAVSILVPKAVVRTLAANVVALPAGIGGLVTGRLGDLHGWISAATSEIRLELRLDVG